MLNEVIIANQKKNMIYTDMKLKNTICKTLELIIYLLYGTWLFFLC